MARDGLFLILLLYLLNLYQTRNIADIAPDLNAQTVSGEAVELRKMLKDSPVLIYF